MTSKVLVKMPEVPFAQVKKPNADIVPTVSSSSDLARSVSQLQENIRFLQTKHQQMLTSLHDEVDILKKKNRDLQIQLVLSKNNSPSTSTISSTNTDDTIETKLARNIEEISISKETEPENDIHKQRCIQLEKELTVTKTALQTSLARTAALQALLQQNKIQEVPWMAQQCSRVANVLDNRGVDNQGEDDGEGEEQPQLQSRLDEAERLVRRLRAETEEQRRELQSIKASLSAVGRGNGGNRGGGNHRGGVMHQRFPPLQNQQAFWQQQAGHPQQQRENNDYQGWNRRRSNDKMEPVNQGIPNQGLPDLRANHSQGSFNNGNIGQNQPRRGNNHGYNNHYYRNSDRGHRREDDQQHKNYNTPADLSEGEVEAGVENLRNNSYKHKRGHNKQQDKN